ncbi:MAG: Zn-ribbon domain-containing OB-fold protein [Candidatus Binataceae bacterium]
MAEARYEKPLPLITPLNQPYWDGLRRRELRLQRCGACARFWYPPSPLCPYCWSREFAWTVVSGRGHVNSWVVFHQSYFRGYDHDLPYNAAEVELEEGPRLLTNLIDIPNEQIRSGMRVRVAFDDVTEEITLAKFRPET